ncbi:hypothetical protein B0H11DRAFT_1963851 [Mycena galericulata]|nr:hypothetical protein B0H11DRAFT_1963851 [Mycena galericulata]
MTDQPSTEAGHPPKSTSILPNPVDELSRYDGAFFAGAQHFVVNGGDFTNNIFNSLPDVPSDFKRIPLGDVDLRHEIRMDASGVVHREGARTSTKKMYSARIEGRQSDMTVAVYQGENAEEKWKRELAKYAGIRHPNFVQPFGIVSSAGLYATVFHDELVPVREYIEEYRHSMISTVYLYVYLVRPFAVLLLDFEFHQAGELQVPSQEIFPFSLFNISFRMQPYILSHFLETGLLRSYTSSQ